MSKAFLKSRLPGQPDPVSCHVGARLRLLRTLARHSQQALAEGLGVSFQQVQKYEKGINRMSVDMLYRAAQFFAEPVDWFFAHMPAEAGAPPPTQSQALGNDEAALIAAWRRLPRSERASVGDLIDTLAHRSAVPPAAAE